MSKQPEYWNKAKKHLSKKDRIMKNLINKYSDSNLTSRKDIFYSLCKSIIGQQISVAAANSVFLKFKKKCNNKINAKIVTNLTFKTKKWLHYKHEFYRWSSRKCWAIKLCSF